MKLGYFYKTIFMLMRVSENQMLVIFGASGDLTRRKLIPALFALHKQKLLPEAFAIVGAGRADFSDEDFRKKTFEALKESANKDLTRESADEFLRMLHYVSFDTSQPQAYSKLKEKIEHTTGEHGTGGNCIFYLATPPDLYATVAQSLAMHGLNMNTASGWKRLIIEKPVGYNQRSARELHKSLYLYLHENQLYRLDHYLGKETVQNVMVKRFSNGIFEPLWNRNYIHHVEITSAESLGIENRGGYYDKAGALRDMVQNQLLQLMTLVAMEPPPLITSNAIRNETLKVLQSVRPIPAKEVAEGVIRGQYTESTIPGI